MKVELRVKRINPKAKLPAYAHTGDAGLDVYSVESLVIKPDTSRLIKTGIVIEIPVNTEAQVRPRSGLALKYQVTVLNSPGTIDAGFRGEIAVLIINHGSKEFKVKVGDRIAQLVIAPICNVIVLESKSLSKSARGKKGFGSTEGWRKLRR